MTSFVDDSNIIADKISPVRDRRSTPRKIGLPKMEHHKLEGHVTPNEDENLSI